MRLSFWQHFASSMLPALTLFSLSGLIAFAFMLRLSPWLALLLAPVIIKARHQHLHHIYKAKHHTPQQILL